MAGHTQFAAPDLGKANRNALAEALAQQKFIGGIKASKQASLERGLTSAAVSAEGPDAQRAAILELGAQNPVAAQDAFTFLSSLSDSDRDAAEKKVKFLGKAALGILAAEDNEKPQLYEAALIQAAELGFDVSALPPQYSPEIEPQLQTMLGQAMTSAEQIKRISDKTGAGRNIVKLQAARVEARKRGDEKSVREIQAQIDKINAPAIGRTQYDPGVDSPTTANVTRSQAIIDDGDFTLSITQELRDVIASKNLGAVGSIREFFQGIGQQLEAIADTIVDQSIARGDDLNLGLLFTLDPNLSGQKLLENILAYRLALANNPDGRISDPDFKAAQKSLGFDKTLTGAGDIIARLDVFDRLIRRQQSIARRRLGLPEPAKEPVITRDTGVLATDLPEGKRAFNKVTDKWMVIRNGEWEAE